MRVLETKLTSGAGMGKRKHKIRKSKSQEYASDSSDEGAMAGLYFLTLINISILVVI